MQLKARLQSKKPFLLTAWNIHSQWSSLEKCVYLQSMVHYFYCCLWIGILVADWTFFYDSASSYIETNRISDWTGGSPNISYKVTVEVILWYCQEEYRGFCAQGNYAFLGKVFIIQLCLIGLWKLCFLFPIYYANALLFKLSEMYLFGSGILA